MRLFIAVNLNDEVKNKILILQNQLRAQASKGTFTQPQNLHITLAFLGETPGERLDSLYALMAKLPPASFEAAFNRTGFFTHSRKELWWIGMDNDSPGHKQLEAIHARLAGLLLDAGFSVDTRPFNAHITLGREIKHSGPIILDYPDIGVRVDRISLMQSEHIRGRLTYTEIFYK